MFIESLRLEKTSKIKSNRETNTTMPAQPCAVAAFTISKYTLRTRLAVLLLLVATLGWVGPWK